MKEKSLKKQKEKAKTERTASNCMTERGALNMCCMLPSGGED